MRKQGTEAQIAAAERMRVVKRPSVEELTELVRNNSIIQVGKMFGDSAIRKWCNSYQIDWRRK